MFLCLLGLTQTWLQNGRRHPRRQLETCDLLECNLSSAWPPAVKLELLAWPRYWYWLKNTSHTLSEFQAPDTELLLSLTIQIQLSFLLVYVPWEYFNKATQIHIIEVPQKRKRQWKSGSKADNKGPFWLWFICILLNIYFTNSGFDCYEVHSWAQWKSIFAFNELGWKCSWMWKDWNFSEFTHVTTIS